MRCRTTGCRLQVIDSAGDWCWGCAAVISVLVAGRITVVYPIVPLAAIQDFASGLYAGAARLMSDVLGGGDLSALAVEPSAVAPAAAAVADRP